MNKNFLTELLETASPSGYEKAAADIWRREAEKFADMVYVDTIGNSMAKVSSPFCKLPTKIMLAGHIDEIGMIISAVDVKSGILRFQPIGGWDPQIFPGQRVRVYAKTGKVVTGCIGRTPIHLLEEEERKRVVKPENLWIDVGGKKNAEGIAIGDYAVIAYGTEFLGDALVARGIDDRIGAFVVLEALRLVGKAALENEIIAVATVQEEIGHRGAITSSYVLEPRIGIAVDVTHATDYPGAPKARADIKLGGGPVIAIGPNIHPGVHESLVETAKAHRIPYQIQAEPRGTGTDANAIQLSRTGVATGLVSIPNRYMHSPCEMVYLKDMQNTVKLLAYFCSGDIRKIFAS